MTDTQRFSPAKSVVRLAAPFAGIVAVALMSVLWLDDRTIYRAVLKLWGVPVLGLPFLDLVNLNAAVECWRRGVDVYLTNPCDPLGRVFPYSPLWLVFGYNLPNLAALRLAGLGLDLGFVASLWLVFRPVDAREGAIAVLATISTPCAYAAERANVDLLIFMMLVLAASTIRRGSFTRWLGYLMILAASMLKFYPLAALVITLRETMRRFMAIGFLALAAMVAITWSLGSNLTYLAADIPGGHYGSDAFGAQNLLYLLLGPHVSHVTWGLCLMVLGGCAALFGRSVARRFGTVDAYSRLGEIDRTHLVLGAAIIVGCFFAGQSIIYRAIYLLPAVAGLMAARRAAETPAMRTAIGWQIGASILLMWDGAVQAVLYPHGQIPALYLVVREALWWWVVSSLLGWIFAFARRSEALAFARDWTPKLLLSRRLR